MEVIPLPYSLGETAPAFFREAMMTADEEWAQHKKVINTLEKARKWIGEACVQADSDQGDALFPCKSLSVRFVQRQS